MKIKLIFLSLVIVFLMVAGCNNKNEGDTKIKTAPSISEAAGISEAIKKRKS